MSIDVRNNRTRTTRRNRVTISDVSEALGLTKSTVSRALNDYPDIAPSTRNRVRQQARKMGYEPLSQAQAIKTGRTRSLGLVIQVNDHDGHRPFLADFLAGISLAASARNWTLTVAASDSDDATLQTMSRLLNERKADGFILPRTLHVDPRIDMLRAQEVPFVLFGRTGDETGCAWFDIRGEESMRQSVLHLHGLGHRRIAFLNGGELYHYSKLRLEGYRRGLAEAGLRLDPALMRTGCMTAEDGMAAGRELLALTEPPSAIVCAVDGAALGLYRAAEERGLRIGRDLSVVSYDGVPEGATMSPPLSTYAVDIRSAGERLGDLLIRRIRGTPAEELRETTEAVLDDRGSIGPPPEKTHSQ